MLILSTEKWLSATAAAKIAPNYSPHQIRGIIDRITSDDNNPHRDLVAKLAGSKRSRYLVSTEFVDLLKSTAV